jgi:hypothetical protein
MQLITGCKETAYMCLTLSCSIGIGIDIDMGIDCLEYTTPTRKGNSAEVKTEAKNKRTHLRLTV